MKYSFLILLLSIFSCHKGSKPEKVRFQNPVFEPVFADPTVLRTDEGVFYAYATQDDWGDGQGSRLVPIIKSVDFIHWEYVGNAFQHKPDWKTKGGIWAPDIVKVEGRYHLYYSFSTWGDSNPGIGLAVADHPAGPFEDKGKLFLSDEINVPNSIDPYYLEDNGKKFLFWGSYNNGENQGTYGVQLSDDGTNVPDPTSRIKVAAGDFEAVVIHKKGEYYYFIGSKGGCCDGENSSYHLRVGRSKNLFGPYRDEEGNDLKEPGAGTLLLKGDSKFAGPGHNSRLIQDKNKTDWMLYHAILQSNPRLNNGTNRRVLMLGKVLWKNGWPYLKTGTPITESRSKPRF